MSKPWSDLSSAERLDAILLAVHECEERGATAGYIAHAVAQRHPMANPRYSMRGRGRQVSAATRVTPGITALRKRGLIGLAPRPDGLSGTADCLTPEGDTRVRELLLERLGGADVVARRRARGREDDGSHGAY
jgi:hypothetical protein